MMAKQTKKPVSPHTAVWVDQEDKTMSNKEFSLYEHKDTITSSDTIVSNTFLEDMKAYIDTVSTQLPTDKTTRFEVINDTGRRLVQNGVSIEISMQDDGRTMKVFLTKIKGGQDNE
jgi:GH35 family endo-1,4-beta-xylanase